jgi:hypothetical protein
MELKEKDDRVNCFACPKGTSGAVVSENRSVYNDYRGDFESYKMYLKYPTFKLSNAVIDGLESDQRTTCEYCPNGWFSDVEGAVSCIECPAGWQSEKEKDSPRIPKCVACDLGKREKERQCVECPIAKFTTVKGSTECVDCPAGTFSEDGGGGNSAAGEKTVMCKECPIGYYSDEPKSLMCTSCVSIGFINEKRNKKGVTLQSRSNHASACVCPPFTFDLATVDPLADGNNDWYLSSDFTQSRCETRLRFTDKAICGSPDVCAFDVFSLMDNLAKQDVEFQAGDQKDCPARCSSPNTTGTDLQLQPGWWRANQMSLLFLDCKQDGTEFWRADCVGSSANDNNTTSTNTSVPASGGARRRLVALLNTTNSTKSSSIAVSRMGCGVHTRGPLCRTCEDGYTRQGLTCKPCATKNQRTLPISLFIIVVFFTCIVYTISMRKSWKEELSSMEGNKNEDESGDLNGKKGELEGQVGVASDIKNSAATMKKKASRSAKDSEKFQKSSKAVTGAAISGSKALSATFNRAGGNSSSNPLKKIKTSTKQLLTFMQLSCSFIITFDQIDWPISFKSLSLSGAFSNLDFIAYLQGIDVPEYCSLTMPFLEQFWWHMMLTPVLVATLLTMFMLNRICCLTGAGNKKKAGRSANANTFWNFLNMILFLLYPGLAQRVFQVYKCTKVQEVPSVRIGLAQDMTIECHEGVHAFHVAFATLFLVVYVMGIPAFMFYVLFSNRKEIHDKESPRHAALGKRFGSLYDQYESEFCCSFLVVLVVLVIMAAADADANDIFLIHITCLSRCYFPLFQRNGIFGN